MALLIVNPYISQIPRHFAAFSGTVNKQKQAVCPEGEATCYSEMEGSTQNTLAYDPQPSELQVQQTNLPASTYCLFLTKMRLMRSSCSPSVCVPQVTLACLNKYL
jgi:hypothetical protein